ncbi:MAG: sulfotransferase family protein [Conexibacter sp.]
MTSAPAERQPAVVVLGYHRSGTSMVTRMLNLLGVDLGDEAALLPPEERDNARGYWEPRWMIDLNEEILAAVGSGTFAPFAPEPGWERAEALEPLRERARALLDEHFAGRALWGWKDPRTSLTLPFWRELIDGPLRCVLCVRSPADAVASLLRRNVGIDGWTYAERWLDHVALALAATAPAERTVVFYEDALRDPAGEAHRIAAFLGMEAPSSEALAPIVASVDPELRHHRTSAWDVAIDPALPLATRALYLQLRAARRLEDDSGSEASGASERLRDALMHVGAAMRDMYGELLATRGEASAADSARDRAEQALVERDVALADAADRLRSSDEHAQTLAREREHLMTQVAELRDALAARDAALATITHSRSWRLMRPLRTLGRRARAR